MTAEKPQSGGVEQQPWDEEQQVEVEVHRIHALIPAGHIVATVWEGLVLPKAWSCVQSHLNVLTLP